jgi:S1-C subfamily serine protease
MTITDPDFLDQLDHYIKGTLSPEAHQLLEERMGNDVIFKQKVESHLQFIETLQRTGNREALKTSLSRYHNDLTPGFSIEESRPHTGIRQYWPSIAIAASVAFISVVGTLVATQSLEKKQTADYKELRKNVEQIKKSQKAMMEDLQEVKGNDPLPGNYEGTGFLISSNGYVATSYHVIRDADSVFIENKKYGRLKASIVKGDPKNDVAILKIEQVSFRAPVPYTIHADEAALGESVFTLGFPREDIVYGEGTVSASSGYGRNMQAYQIAVPVNPGNSGGPLLNKQGQLVGIISGQQTETQGAAFATKSSVLLAVLGEGAGDSLVQHIQLPKLNKLKMLNRVDQIKKLQDVVFVVRVYNSK